MSTLDGELVTVFEAANPAEAHIVCSMLLDEGLAAQVIDENDAFSGVSTLNVGAVVVRRGDAARAQTLIAEYEERQRAPRDETANDDS